MKQIDLRKLSFPKNVHMQLLFEILTEREIVKLLNFFAEKPPSQRIIRFPRRKVILKAISFYYGELVMAGSMTWEQAVRELRIKFGSLEKFGLGQKEIKRLYKQRKREIARELK